MTDPAVRPNQSQRGDSGDGPKVALIVGIVVLVLVVIAGIAFFALGGDADVDVDPGDVDVTVPEADIDVNAPDIDVESPDVSVDPGDVDVDDAPDADAEVGNDGS